MDKKLIKIIEKKWHETTKQEIYQYFKKINPRLFNVLKTIKPLTVEKVNCSYLFGAVGTGKSVHAAQLLIEWSRIQTINKRYRRKYIFVSVVEMLNELRSSYSDSQSNEQVILEKYKSIPFLVLDDIGSQKVTDWTYQALYMIVAYRYDHMLTTIYTSNLSLGQLAETLSDDRITSRIAYSCKDSIFEFKDNYIFSK